MKEKRVDIYLAKAGFYQLIFIGFGGAWVAEVVKDEPSPLNTLRQKLLQKNKKQSITMKEFYTLTFFGFMFIFALVELIDSYREDIKSKKRRRS